MTDRRSGDTTDLLTVRSERVRQAAKLTRRAAREKAGRFLAEGAQAVREAVAEPDRVTDLFVTDEARRRHSEVVDAALTGGANVYRGDEAALASLSETVTPQGLVAICRPLTVDLDTVLRRLGPPAEEMTEPTARDRAPVLVTVLVDARDPGNAGTVIRCADAAGSGAVVLTRGSVDPQGGKAVRASAGSLFHLPIATGAPTEDVVDGLRRHGLTVLAADGSGDRDLDEVESAGLLGRPTAWLFGNEAHGFPVDVLDLADHIVRVPIHGRAESLNLATAAAVCLYASARVQRRRAPVGAD